MGPPRIAAVVLAAGGSTRLGEPKQLVSLGCQPVLAHVLETVRDASVDERFVVLGHEILAVQQSVDSSGFQVIENPEYALGQSTSVVAAVGHMPEDIGAIIFVLGDQPLQSLTVIDRIANSWRADPAPIIQPEYQEGPGNPVLFDRKLFSSLLELTGDTGARPILKANRDMIRRVDCTDYNRPLDVDTREDVEKLRAVWSERSGACDV